MSLVTDYKCLHLETGGCLQLSLSSHLGIGLRAWDDSCFRPGSKRRFCDGESEVILESIPVHEM